MGAKIVSLYSTIKGNVKSRRKNDGDLRSNMPRTSELKGSELNLGMIMGGASHNVVARHFNVHRTIVQRLVKNLEKKTDRPAIVPIPAGRE